MLRISLLVGCFLAFGFSQTADAQNCHLVGAWETVSQKLIAPDGTVSESEIGDPPGLKVLTESHFIFIEQNPPGSAAATSGGGGSYVVTDTTFTETVMYHVARDFIGMTLPFHCKVEGDLWTQTGYLPGGTYIEQVYRRVDSKED